MSRARKLLEVTARDFVKQAHAEHRLCLRLTADVEYEMEGASPDTLARLLRDVIRYAYEEGTITHDEPATVRNYNAAVVRIDNIGGKLLQ